MHYTRAYVDRDATTDDGPIRFIAATEGRKADNIDLRMTGARLDRFRSNPVVGYGHRYWTREDLPIGRGTHASVEDGKLLIDVEFDQDDDFAQRIERKYRSGFMNAVSIGFDVIRWEGGKGSYWGGGVAEEWEPYELSAVPVPMDGSAVVESGRARGLDLRELLAEIPLDPSVVVELDEAMRTRSVRVTEELLQHADPLSLALHLARALATAPTRAPAAPAPEPTPDPEPAPEPPTPEMVVGEDAARSLLAALTMDKE